jgi:hypothetical protein
MGFQVFIVEAIEETKVMQMEKLRNRAREAEKSPQYGLPAEYVTTAIMRYASDALRYVNMQNTGLATSLCKSGSGAPPQQRYRAQSLAVGNIAVGESRL